MKLFPKYEHYLIFGKGITEHKDKPYTRLYKLHSVGVLTGRNHIVRLLRRIKKLNHE